MKRFCFTLVFLFIVAISVSADTIRTINIQQTTINILPNDAARPPGRLPEPRHGAAAPEGGRCR